MTAPTDTQKTGTLVTLFLRGGADGLGLVAPYADPNYARRRPSLALAPPGNGDGACLDLDGFFGLHPALAPLLPSWREGRLALVHAVGSDDASRSHFEAQDQMERGVAFGQRPAGGWLGRYLRRLGGAGGMDAIAIGPKLPESLRGAPGAAAMTSLDELGLRSRSGHIDSERLSAQIAALYGEADELGRAGQSALRLMQRAAELAPEPTTAAAAGYPDGELAHGLAEVARLVRAGVGLRVACIDHGGWDTHFVQGGATGLFADNAAELAAAMHAFDEDLGSAREQVVVLVMTEFGRRAYQNTSLGTDHGRGSVMMVLGSGLEGGVVHGRWPGLDDDELVGPGDLAVTTDYRAVLQEVLQLTGGETAAAVFDGFAAPAVGLHG